MTDEAQLPQSFDDEVVSAALDGEATPSEMARVSAEAPLQARSRVFRSVADAVATPVPAPDDEIRGRLVASALAVAQTDAGTAPDEQRGGADEVPSLATRRAASRQRVVAIAAAAAAVIIVPVMAVAVLRASQNDNATSDEVATGVAPKDGADDEESASADALTGPNQERAGEPSMESTVPSALPFTGPAAAVPDLGAVGSEPELQDVVATARTQAPAPADTTPSSSSPPAPVTSTTVGGLGTPRQGVTASACAEGLRGADPSLGDLLYTATATYRGSPVNIDVFRPAQGTSEIVVVTASTDCSILTRFTL
jgi:hypothetical protein